MIPAPIFKDLLRICSSQEPVPSGTSMAVLRAGKLRDARAEIPPCSTPALAVTSVGSCSHSQTLNA